MKITKKAKWIISLSVIVGFIGLLFLLSFTAFSLKTVEIDYRTSISKITSKDNEIIKSANFKMGGSVFFHKKKDYVKNIENFNPYIKVINIETVFPSKFVVHIAERQEVYAIESGENYYVCDENFRVLRIAEGEDELPMVIELETPLNQNYKEGEYIKNDRVPDIYNAFFEYNRNLGEQKALVEKITLTSEYDGQLKKHIPVTSIKVRSGQTFKILNDSQGFKYKIKMMLDIFSQMYDFVGKTINVNDEQVVLTEENIDNCIFIISNYYNYVDHTEKDCWFDIILN